MSRKISRINSAVSCSTFVTQVSCPPATARDILSQSPVDRLSLDTGSPPTILSPLHCHPKKRRRHRH